MSIDPLIEAGLGANTDSISNCGELMAPAPGLFLLLQSGARFATAGLQRRRPDFPVFDTRTWASGSNCGLRRS